MCVFDYNLRNQGFVYSLIINGEENTWENIWRWFKNLNSFGYVVFILFRFLAWQFNCITHHQNPNTFWALLLIGLFSTYKGNDDLGTGYFLRVNEQLGVNDY